MSRINISQSSSISRFDAPDQALRRLNLSGAAGKGFLDVVNGPGEQLAKAVVQIDGERQKLELGFGQADEAVGVLKSVEEKLAEIKTLVASNNRGGSSPGAKSAYQKRIDALLKEIETAFDEAGKSLGGPLFEGNTRLTAGERTMDIPELSLDRLGRISVGGRTVHLGELKSRGQLDTFRRQGLARTGAERTVNEAIKQVETIRAELETFTKETIRPRVADVAEVMSSIYTALTEINTSAEAQEVLKQVRELTLKSSSVAVAIGADEWDRERVLDLLS